MTPQTVGKRNPQRKARLFLPGPLDTCLPGIEEIEVEPGRGENEEPEIPQISAERKAHPPLVATAEV
jgi:hypothetical protein